MNEAIDKECQRWAEFCLGQQLERGKNRLGDKFDQWVIDNQNAIEEFKQNCVNEWQERAKEISDKCIGFCNGVRQGRFHPSNSHSRRLFQAVTGITLPSTVSGTNAALDAYAGQQLASYGAAKQEEKRLEEEAERQAEEGRHLARMERIAESIRANKEIDGESLLDMAKHLGVSIPIQSMGAIRRRVYCVNSYSSRIVGRGKFESQAHFKAYKQCRELLQESTTTATQ